MERRQFIKLSSIATTTGLVPSPFLWGGGVKDAGKQAETINFTTDGLGLDPREYTSLLSQLAAETKINADYYSRGGAVDELEQQFARLLGKESAVFMPTGTLANHIAVRKLTGDNRRVLVQAESHLYNDSGDCAEVMSGLNLIPLAPGQATLTLDEVRGWVERTSSGRVETKIGVISIESPVRRKRHELFDFEEMNKISVYAHEHGIKLHLDGARLFNVPQHSGRKIEEYTALFDTVYVSLWKCFNAASGAMLAGSKQFTEGLYHVRRMFGGSLPQAWPLIAVAARYAESYLTAYAGAWETADGLLSILQKDDRFKVEKIPNGTSIFKMGVTGIASERFLQRLRVRNIILSPPDRNGGTFWMTVNTTLNRVKPEDLADRFLRAAAA
ncbi:MAG: threonine aldolase family protein [bacterium]